MTDTKPDQWDVEAEAKKYFEGTWRKDSSAGLVKYLAAFGRLAHEQGVTAGKIEAFEEALKEEWNSSSGMHWRERTREKIASLRAPAKGKP